MRSGRVILLANLLFACARGGLPPLPVQAGDQVVLAVSDGLFVVGDEPVYAAEAPTAFITRGLTADERLGVGEYPLGEAHACPLPVPDEVLQLDDGGAWRAAAGLAAPWYEDPSPTPTALEIFSTCGAGSGQWQATGTRCAVEVRSEEPAWLALRLGLEQTRGGRRMHVHPSTPRACTLVDALSPALGTLRCVEEQGPCAIDLYAKTEAFEVARSPALERPLSRSARYRIRVREPYQRLLQGLALLGDRVWVASAPTLAGFDLDCSAVSRVVALDAETLEVQRQVMLPVPYQCAVDLFEVPGRPGPFVLARSQTSTVPACPRPDPRLPSGRPPQRAAAAWALLELNAEGALAHTFPLGDDCASYAVVAQEPQGEAVHVALVWDADPDEQQVPRAILHTIDPRAAVEVTRLALDRTTLDRDYELASLLPLGGGRWAAYDRLNTQLVGLRFEADRWTMDLGITLPRSLVSINAHPIALTFFEPGHRLLGWLGVDRGGSGFWATAPGSSDQFGDFESYPASTAPADTTAVRSPWPLGSRTSVVLSTERDGDRVARVRLFEAAENGRLRLRSEQVEIGYGAVGARTAVDARGRLFTTLTWDAEVVRVTPRPGVPAN